MFEAGNRARRDCRSCFKIFGGDAGKRRAANLIARTFPSLARNAQHRRFAGSGITNDDTQVFAVGGMIESVALLAGQRKAARVRRCQRAFFAALANAMPLALRHRLRSALQPRFNLDHIARSEAIFSAPVLAKRNQIGRGLHRAHRQIELLFPFRMAMHEHRQVALGEGRLLPGDRVQCDIRVRDDPLAVAMRDGGMIGDALALKTLLRHTQCGRADLVLRG